ncbi:induced myeloid leukemia cell differentiation protein Mcl-1 [Rhinophrynus dorsalis]
MMNQSLMSLSRKSPGIITYPLYCCTASGVENLPGKHGAASACADLQTDRPEGKLDRPRQLNGLGFNTDGSLPSSQGELDDELDDTDPVSRGSTSPPLSPLCVKDRLYMDTRQLIIVFFKDYAAGEDGGLKASLLHGPGGHHKAQETLERVGRNIIEKHGIAFNGMLQKLSINSTEDLQKLSGVPSMVFNDGNTNWGRIVTLISFGAFVAKHLRSIHLEDGIVSLADTFTEYLMNNKREWIIKERGWDGFVDFFHIEDYESGLRNVLVAVAGVAGLGASLAYMIR